MMEASASAKHRRHFAWSAAERLASQGALFLATVILARLLTPADFGLVGMLLIFLEVGEALASSGFMSALVRRGFRDPDDARSAWWFNFTAGWLLYLIIWEGAPLIADFYDSPRLTALARVMGVIVPLRSMAVVSIARLTVAVDFRRQAIASFSSIILAAAAAIAVAVKGYGVWALVVFQTGQYLLLCIALAIAAYPLRRKAPAGRCSLSVIEELFSFGWKLTGARLADVAYNNSYLMAIGLAWAPAQVGLFTRARQFATVPAISCSEIVKRVAYPLLCRLHPHAIAADEATEATPANEENMMRPNSADPLLPIRKEFLKMLTGSMYIALPLLLTIAALARPLVITVLGEQWAPAAPLLAWLAIGGAWIPMDALNLTLLTACGRPAEVLRLELLRKLIGIGILGATLFFGLKAVCAGYAATSIITMLITAAWSGRHIEAGMTVQLRALAAPCAAATAAAAAAYLTASAIAMLFNTMAFPLAAGCGAAFSLYLLLSAIFRLHGFKTLTSVFKSSSHP